MFYSYIIAHYNILYSHYIVDDPSNKLAVLCYIEICNYQTCPNIPQAKCKLDICGECQVQFYLNNNEVTNKCTKYCNNILTTCTVVSLSLFHSVL